MPQFTETASVGELLLLCYSGSSLPIVSLPFPGFAGHAVPMSPKEGWGPSYDSCYLAIFSSLQPFLATTTYRLELLRGVAKSPEPGS